MIGLRQLARVGPTLDAIGNVVSPVVTPRFMGSAPALRFHSGYEGSGLDVLGTETIEEALIERGRAMEWRGEAPMLGRLAGGAIAIAIGAYLTRWLARK